MCVDLSISLLKDSLALRIGHVVYGRDYDRHLEDRQVV